MESLATYTFEFREPSAFTNADLDAFADLVIEGGQVNKNVRERLPTAAALGVIRLGDAIVGTAGIKNPTANHRTECFTNADQLVLQPQYPLELGWVYLPLVHRGHKVMGPLIGQMIAEHQATGMFATTMSDNEDMQRILDRTGFKRVGKSYPSKQNKGQLGLYIREPTRGRG